MSADFVVRDGGTLIYASPSPGVSTAIGDFPGLALMDLMKPYMQPSRENYERVLKDIHGRAIQMWAGCIWVPIYEVMTRKHLKLVTLAENLEMAADIGIDATTSLDEAFAEAMKRHGPDAKGNGAFHRLAGQLPDYTFNKLVNWGKERGQDRANPDTSAIMAPIAHNCRRCRV